MRRIPLEPDGTAGRARCPGQRRSGRRPRGIRTERGAGCGRFDPTASIAAASGLALAIAAAGSTDEAVAIAQGAIETCRRIGDRHLEAAVENHLADILHDAGREAEAMEHLKRAVALFAEIGEGEPERDPGDLGTGGLVTTSWIWFEAVGSGKAGVYRLDVDRVEDRLEFPQVLV